MVYITVIQPKNVNRITIDIIKPLLLAAQLDSGYQLDDPVSSRAFDSNFILSAYPKRTVEYPHIILEDISTTGKRIDLREVLQENKATIRIMVRSLKNTHAFQIMAGVREAIQRGTDTLNAAGFVAPTITGTSSTTMEGEDKIFVQTLTVQGTIYSAYST